MSAAHVEPRAVTHTGEVVRAGFLAVVAIAGYAVVLARSYILPDTFFGDGDLIRSVALGTSTADDFYTNTARVYAFFGLQHSPDIAALLGYTLALVAVLLVFLRLHGRPAGWAMTFVTAMTIMLSAVYLGDFSKDALVVPITIAVLALPAQARWTSLIIVIILVYGIQFRAYWLAIAGLFAAYFLLLRRTRSLWILVSAALALGAILSIAIFLALGVPATSFRASANEYRNVVETGSIIEPFVSFSEPLSSVVNTCLTLLSLIVPWTLFVRLSPYYTAVAGAMLTLWLTFFVGLRRTGAADVRALWCAALPIALLTVQALFEPDYGSALRHLTPLLPLFLYLSWAGTARRRIVISESYAPKATLKRDRGWELA